MGVFIMKSWKKIIVATSLGLALSFGGYSVLAPKVKSVLEQKELKKSCSNFLEEYKSLSLDSLVSKDFHSLKVKTVSQDEEWFSVYKKDLHVWYVKDHKHNLKILWMDNNQGFENKVSFEVWLTTDGKPYGVTGMIYKREYRDAGSISQMVSFWDNSIYGDRSFDIDPDGYMRPCPSKKIKDEKLITDAKEIFELASKNYKIIDSLEKKQ